MAQGLVNFNWRAELINYFANQMTINIIYFNLLRFKSMVPFEPYINFSYQIELIILVTRLSELQIIDFIINCLLYFIEFQRFVILKMVIIITRFANTIIMKKLVNIKLVIGNHTKRLLLLQQLLLVIIKYNQIK